ncbi:response regulator [Blastopirellula marina]|uniref:Probable two component system, transcriptional regulatory protein n=1 Tax=Blastopirellula marina DSM 3645 TaxID=314230 RepID=A3ZXP3_9BACT|nr:response regulator [Blastopirellula marina]EAQ78611.1 probable two component system, transcriptional regulatory protein [Blastopirellula marina DSM 3645]
MQHRILVVDDSLLVQTELRELLDSTYEVAIASNVRECREIVGSFLPHLILLDLQLPDGDGHELCEDLRRMKCCNLAQILIFSSTDDSAKRLALFNSGADDFLLKTINRHELLAKIRVHLRLQDAIYRAESAEDKLQKYSHELERIVDSRAQAIEATQDIAVFALAKLADSRDVETGEHLVRMRAYSQILAEQLHLNSEYSDEIDDAFLSDLYRSSPLHDIGKVGISDAILLKPGRLTPDEYEVMKGHAEIGAQTLEEVARSSYKGDFFRMAAQVARHHHERWDGAGYPAGLKGRDIPLCARIVAVADVFDALTSKRVYKDAFEVQNAYDLILSESGKHFDPTVVSAFVDCFDKFTEIASRQSNVHHADSSRRLATPRYRQAMEYAASPISNNPKVLVIEDDLSMGRMIETWLSEAGYEVTTCGDAASALRVIQTNQPQYVITDWMMPTIDGETVCRWTRDALLTHYIYTIVISADIRPETRLRAFHAGADDFMPKPLDRNELLAHLHAASRVVALESRPAGVSRNDPLTGLATRRQLDEQLEREWFRAVRYHLPLSCVVIDIDSFEEINNQYGFEAGDQVIQRIAQIVQGHTRLTDYVCRLAGDRFLIAMVESNESQAAQFAERLCKVLAGSAVTIHGQTLTTTASFGVAQTHADTTNLDKLIELAEEAIVIAKQLGRNRVVRRSATVQSVELPHAANDWCMPLANALAHDVMTSPIVTLRESDTARSALRFLLRYRINSAPVVDHHGMLCGVLSEKDLMCHMTDVTRWDQPIGSSMSSDVVYFEEDDTAETIYNFLIRASIRRVVVVRDGRPTGVISRGSLLRWFNRQQELESETQTAESLENRPDAELAESVSNLLKELEQSISLELAHGTSNAR